MNYYKWTPKEDGVQEGFLPDLGLVAPGRIVRTSTDHQEEAVKRHGEGFTAIGEEEGAVLYEKQAKQDLAEQNPPQEEAPPVVAAPTPAAAPAPAAQDKPAPVLRTSVPVATTKPAVPDSTPEGGK